MSNYLRQKNIKMPFLTPCALRKSVILDHHLYHEWTNTWVKEPSQPQPYIKLLMSVQHEDYEQFGFAPQTNQWNATIYAMADTGFQSCLVGIDNVRKLGLHKFNLIPVKMRIHAANNDNINILGATILRFSGQDRSGNVVETTHWSMSPTHPVGYSVHSIGDDH